MNVIEIPVSNKNQQFDIQLGGGRYRIRLVYRQFCGWVVDMMTQTGSEIFTGVPLVSGVDILEAYRYTGIPVSKADFFFIVRVRKTRQIGMN